ncbi:MAG: aminotransferase class I/II-fold pyridoxal phosphate-dependent enzyme [Phycisphaerales bacterium]|jgi:N-succinyldiaminopimelate aminotransferase|nr:aminotransferase class I/II-fold pyridoxal phosphate-dependent enzyme [Phycisphaerales bacterium]
MTIASRHGVSGKLRPFGTTIFAEMTRLAVEHRAVNLSQGFPDFDGPEFVRDAAADALLRRGENQYARMPGVPALGEAISAWFVRGGGWPASPDAEITVTSGCTEAIAATMLGLLNPGDEVVLFEPFYDSYRACVALAGATPRFVTLRPGPDGRFGFDEQELEHAITERTRMVLLNTPHNPTGKVFTRAELDVIARACVGHDLVCVSDEVYERLVYDGHTHVPIASLPGMRERTVTLSSIGKTFSVTGWKIGWAIAPAHLTAGVRAAHQFLTFAVATPLQHGAAVALAEGEGYVRDLVAQYARKRDRLAAALSEIGFDVRTPEGTYFIMAGHERVSARLGVRGDVELCRAMTRDFGVAAIPPSVFYDEPAEGAGLVRFAFCKRDETLEEAITRLRRMRV